MKNKIGQWKVLSSSLELDSPWVKVRRETILLPDDSQIDDYYIIERRDIVVVFAKTSTHQVVFVEQYKHGVRTNTLELPAGMIDSNEKVIDAARRELREETGYTAKRWKVIGSFFDDPTRNTNKVHAVLAFDAIKTEETKRDPQEKLANLQTTLHSFNNLPELLKAEIKTVSSVATIYQAMAYLSGGR
ncbi:MAG: NUDIX hydrolase [bacterium]|nr:NUDIX hydrolase [bacterium]